MCPSIWEVVEAWVVVEAWQALKAGRPLQAMMEEVGASMEDLEGVERSLTD